MARDRTRTALLLRTALGGLALLAGPALALPGAPTTVATNTGGGAPVLTNAGTVQTIKLNAPRTVLQYGGFTVGGTETVNFRFDNRSDLAVVHATSAAIQINGTLNSYVGTGTVNGGNVWLLSAAGVFFGQNSHVDVGGLLASTSVPSDLLSPTGAVLTPGTLSFTFGDGSGAVTVAAGAQLTGHGGTLAFIAPSVTTAKGSAIGGASNTSVLYGAAQRYTVRFAQESGNDLDLLDFEVPGLTAGTAAALPVTLAGTTSAGNVYVASVSRADTVSAVLAVTGSIATVAGVEGGAIVLSAGSGIVNHAAAPLLAGGSFGHDLNVGGSLDAATSVTAQATGAITLPNVQAGQDIIATAGGTLDIGTGDDGAFAGRDLIARGTALTIGVTSAGRDLSLTATAGGLTTVGFGPALASGRDLTIDVTDDLEVGEIDAVRDLTLTGASVTADDDLVAGRDLTLTARTGEINASVLRAGDDVRITGPIVDAGRVQSTGAGSDSEGDGFNVVVDGGRIALRQVVAPSNIVVTGTGAVVISADGGGGTSGELGPYFANAGLNISITGASVQTGRLDAGLDVDLKATGGDLVARRTIFAGNDVTASATGNASFAAEVGAGHDVVLSGLTVTAADLDAENLIQATGGTVLITAATSRNDILVTATAGDATVTSASVQHDLTILAALGAATLGTGEVGNDLVMSGRSVALTSLSGYPGDPTIPTQDATLTATAGDIDGGDLTVAGDVVATASGAVSLGAIDAGRDVLLTGGTLDIGTIAAGRDLGLTTTASDLTVGDLTAVRDLTLVSSGALVTGDVGAGRDLVLSGTSIDAGDASAAGDVTATADPGSLTIGSVTAGNDVTLTGATLDTGAIDAGRDLSLTATASGISVGDLTAVRDLTLNAATTLAFTSLGAGRDILLTAAVVSGGSASATRDLTIVATDSVSGTLFHAGRDLVIDPDETISATTVSAGGNASLVGASVDVGTLTAGGTTLVQATAGGITLVTFSSGGDAALLATGRVSLGTSTTPYLRVLAGDLDVATSLTATDLDVETPGRMVLGGSAAQGETGFRLAAADMGRLHVSGVASFYAGDTGAANPDTGQGVAPSAVAGGDLIVQDFSYDPADLPRIALFADRAHVVDVQGFIAPTASGAALQIGDANVDGRFRPDSVYVEGGIGSAELVANCFGKIVYFGSISIFAVNDVIFGSTAFRSAVQATPAFAIDIAAGSPSVPRSDDALFAVAARFNIDTGGKIVSQNTSSHTGGYVGLLLAGNGATQPIIDVHNASAIDLSGSVIDANGNLRSGPTVALANELGSGGTNGAVFRFNGCIVGAAACGLGDGSTPSDALRLEEYAPPRPIDITDSPLTTVLIIDQQIDNPDILTIGTDGNAIVVKKKPGE